MSENFKDTFLAHYNRIDKTLTEETGTGLAATLFIGGVTMRALYKAGKNARKGNYPAATYNLLLWHGLNSNYSSSVANHRAKKHSRLAAQRTAFDELRSLEDWHGLPRPLG